MNDEEQRAAWWYTKSVFTDGVLVNIVEGQNPINRKLVVKSLQIHVNRKHGPSVAHHLLAQHRRYGDTEMDMGMDTDTRTNREKRRRRAGEERGGRGRRGTRRIAV
jgi:hypothetical protein